MRHFRRLLSVLAVIAAVVGMVAATASAWTTPPNRAWVIDSNPTPGPTLNNGTVVNGVSCITARDCWAVGATPTAVPLNLFIEHWDGTTWTDRSPTPGVFTSLGGFASVSCTSSHFCMAVGVLSAPQSSAALAWTWDGTTWAPTALPVFPGGGSTGTNLNSYGFSSVSCVSATDCFAAGSGGVGSVIERWNGSAWSLLAPVNPSFPPGINGTVPPRLSGISCTSSTFCLAVGSQLNNPPFDTLAYAERWDGSTWTLVNAPIPDTPIVPGDPTPTGAVPLESLTLTSVSCTSPTACMAVGAGYNIGPAFHEFLTYTASERWDGHVLTAEPTPNVGAAVPPVSFGANTGRVHNGLNSVSCTTARDCTAVGSTTFPFGGYASALAMHWDGKGWKIQNTPASGATQTTLTGVSCVRGTLCEAVGDARYFPIGATGASISAVISEHHG